MDRKNKVKYAPQRSTLVNEGLLFKAPINSPISKFSYLEKLQGPDFRKYARETNWSESHAREHPHMVRTAKARIGPDEILLQVLND